TLCPFAGISSPRPSPGSGCEWAGNIRWHTRGWGEKPGVLRHHSLASRHVNDVNSFFRDAGRRMIRGNLRSSMSHLLANASLDSRVNPIAQKKFQPLHTGEKRLK